ncbi:Hsp20/alpha crystallin family protein [Marinobacterium sediminicola]|uniref:Hsp20/alpha crystallin family protein n=1 Tax=Marinobacterium sediminicola TaxID=518898 RepID=UPI001EEFA730|nr:Hsp20/alpha crystallin family protein [Marinobacterium sediminicola]ULG69545.1 Hsp20/alpha crystallin family protein [Marinobacterium sediminicola]
MSKSLTRFNSLFDDTFLDDFFRPLASRSNGDRVAAIDVHESDSAYKVNVDMPGVKKEDIHISLDNGVLTVKGETRTENKEEKDGKLIRQERHVGQFVRQLSVGSDVDAKAVKAAFEDGVLAITLPKKPAEPKEGVKISID